MKKDKYWELFKQTGKIEYYLKYKEEKECNNAKKS